MAKGNLYLIPVPLGNEKPEDSLPASTLHIIKTLRCFVVEDIRTARRFLRSAGYTGDFSDITFHILNEHTGQASIPQLLNDTLQGADTGLLSEAGAPCVADPGALLVSEAHNKNIKVVPLNGPSSILLALMASGFNGQQFCFHGYLPVKDPARKNKIREIEAEIYRKNQTQIFIETPYRNLQVLKSLIETCRDDTMLSIACNFGTRDQWITTKPISWWKKNEPAFHKKPAVFLLYY